MPGLKINNVQKFFSFQVFSNLKIGKNFNFHKWRWEFVLNLYETLYASDVNIDFIKTK